MRHEASFLRDVLSACAKIEAIAAAISEASFLSEYFDLDLPILWNAAADDIPHLRKQITRIIEIEFPESALT